MQGSDFSAAQGDFFSQGCCEANLGVWVLKSVDIIEFLIVGNEEFPLVGFCYYPATVTLGEGNGLCLDDKQAVCDICEPCEVPMQI